MPARRAPSPARAVLVHEVFNRGEPGADILLQSGLHLFVPRIVLPRKRCRITPGSASSSFRPRRQRSRECYRRGQWPGP